MTHKKLNIIISFFLLHLCCHLSAQNKKIDSLHIVLKNAKHDTTKALICAKLSQQLQNISKYDEAQIYAEKGIEYAQINNFKKGLAHCYFELGYIYVDNRKGEITKADLFLKKALVLYQALGYKLNEAKVLQNLSVTSMMLSKFDDATTYLFKSAKIYEELHKYEALGEVYTNMSGAYSYQSNLPKALYYGNKAIIIFEKLKDQKSLATTYLNVASIYMNLNQNKKGLHYYLVALSYAKNKGNKRIVALCYQNIGVIKRKEKNYKEALTYYLEGLKYKDAITPNDLASFYLNLGIVYVDLKDYTLAESYAKKGLIIATQINDIHSQSGCELSLGQICRLQNNFKQAITHLSSGITLAKQIGTAEKEGVGYEELSKTYSAMGNYKSAYEYHVKYKQLTDSIFNIENSKQLSDIKTNFEVEKKEAEVKAVAKVEREKFKKIAAQEKRQQQLIIYSVCAILLVVLVFSVVVYRSLQQNKKAHQLISAQKVEVEKQKQIISIKNHEINQSINYSLRLQNAIKPHFTLQYLIKDSFVLYQPKDIVSGDFYWFEEKDNKIYIALADSTGHGVPGAFMSMLGTSLLNEIFNRHTIKNAAEIVSTLNKLIKLTFKHHVQTEAEVLDGMDIAVCILNKSTLELEYAGANRPLWIKKPHPNLPEGEEYNAQRNAPPEGAPIAIGIEGLVPDKQSIGGITPIGYEFTNHTIQLQKGDSVYLTTDGYADQFGGDRGKKMKVKKMKEKLLLIVDQPMPIQEEELTRFFNDWKGEQEQVDDVSVIGFRV